MSPVDDDDAPAQGSAAFDSVVGRMEAQLARGRPSGAVEAPEPASISSRSSRSGRSARVASSSATGDRGFVSGVAAGIAGIATVLQMWLAYELAPLRQTYAELAVQPSLLSRLAASAAWRYGSIVALLVLLPVAYGLGPRRRWPLIALAAVAVVVVVFTYVWTRLPLYELSGLIKD